ncbi:MAG: hypothetical protein P1V97_32470, partial [Planctomycetota bacterium]|nr:hypothetical protein [Planctomycetota bacterium]
MSIDELQRQFAAAPNENLRAQLIIALRRRGRIREALDLVKDRFVCPVFWDQLTPSSQLYATDRHCWNCDRSVHFASTVTELAKRGEQNQCIAGPQAVVDEYCESLTNKALPLSKEDERLPRCLISSPGKKASRKNLKHFPKPVYVTQRFANCVPMSPIDEPEGALETQFAKRWVT